MTREIAVEYARRGIRANALCPGPVNTPLLQELLGVDDASYQALVQDAIVAAVPLTGEATPRVPTNEALERGLLAAWDPGYRERLGLS